jgi:hypothetical protein
LQKFGKNPKLLFNTELSFIFISRYIVNVWKCDNELIYANKMFKRLSLYLCNGMIYRIKHELSTTGITWGDLTNGRLREKRKSENKHAWYFVTTSVLFK